MQRWNSPTRPPDIEGDGVDDQPAHWRVDADAAVDAELEAAIEYKLATSGFGGVADIVAVLDRAVRRRWVRGGLS